MGHKKKYQHPWNECLVRMCFYNNNLPPGKRLIYTAASWLHDDKHGSITKSIESMKKRLMDNPNDKVKAETAGYTHVIFFDNRSPELPQPILRQYTADGRLRQGRVEF